MTPNRDSNEKGRTEEVEGVTHRVTVRVQESGENGS